jgi:hypothetical protein
MFAELRSVGAFFPPIKCTRMPVAKVRARRCDRLVAGRRARHRTAGRPARGRCREGAPGSVGGSYYQLEDLPWRKIPIMLSGNDHGHGRDERRTVKIARLAKELLFPHETQTIVITRRTRKADSSRWMASVLVCSRIQLSPVHRGTQPVGDRL